MAISEWLDSTGSGSVFLRLFLICILVWSAGRALISLVNPKTPFPQLRCKGCLAIAAGANLLVFYTWLLKLAGFYNFSNMIALLALTTAGSIAYDRRFRAEIIQVRLAINWTFGAYVTAALAMFLMIAPDKYEDLKSTSIYVTIGFDFFLPKDLLQIPHYGSLITVPLGYVGLPLGAFFGLLSHNDHFLYYAFGEYWINVILGPTILLGAYLCCRRWFPVWLALILAWLFCYTALYVKVWSLRGETLGWIVGFPFLLLLGDIVELLRQRVPVRVICGPILLMAATLVTLSLTHAVTSVIVTLFSVGFAASLLFPTNWRSLAHTARGLGLFAAFVVVFYAVLLGTLANSPHLIETSWQGPRPGEPDATVQFDNALLMVPAENRVPAVRESPPYADPIRLAKGIIVVPLAAMFRPGFDSFSADSFPDGLFERLGQVTRAEAYGYMVLLGLCVALQLSPLSRRIGSRRRAVFWGAVVALASLVALGVFLDFGSVARFPLASIRRMFVYVPCCYGLALAATAFDFAAPALKRRLRGPLRRLLSLTWPVRRAREVGAEVGRGTFGFNLRISRLDGLGIGVAAALLAAAVFLLVWRPTASFSVDLRAVQRNGGNAFTVSLPDPGWLGYRLLGDSPDHPNQSVLGLHEAGQPLGPAHSLHDTIRRSGDGSYSHWASVLYFSASDNTDPRSNGRQYTVESRLNLEPALRWSLLVLAAAAATALLCIRRAILVRAALALSAVALDLMLLGLRGLRRRVSTLAVRAIPERSRNPLRLRRAAAGVAVCLAFGSWFVFAINSARSSSAYLWLSERYADPLGNGLLVELRPLREALAYIGDHTAPGELIVTNVQSENLFWFLSDDRRASLDGVSIYQLYEVQKKAAERIRLFGRFLETADPALLAGYQARYVLAYKENTCTADDGALDMANFGGSPFPTDLMAFRQSRWFDIAYENSKYVVFELLEKPKPPGRPASLEQHLPAALGEHAPVSNTAQIVGWVSGANRRFDTYRVRGWAYAPGHAEPIAVALYAGGKRIAAAEARCFNPQVDRTYKTKGALTGFGFEFDKRLLGTHGIHQDVRFFAATSDGLVQELQCNNADCVFAQPSCRNEATAPVECHPGPYRATFAEGIDFGRRGYPLFVAAASGLGDVEAWGGRRTVGGEVELRFAVDLPRRFVLKLKARAFGATSGQLVSVRVGDATRSFIADNSDHEHDLEFDLSEAVDAVRVNVPHNGEEGSGLGFLSIKVDDRHYAERHPYSATYAEGAHFARPDLPRFLVRSDGLRPSGQSVRAIVRGDARVRFWEPLRPRFRRQFAMRGRDSAAHSMAVSIGSASKTVEVPPQAQRFDLPFDLSDKLDTVRFRVANTGRLNSAGRVSSSISMVHPDRIRASAIEAARSIPACCACCPISAE